LPDIPPVRIVATGVVGWPSPEEMRKLIEEKLLTMTDQELLEFYKLVCELEAK
jgi:hypothetical protein